MKKLFTLLLVLIACSVSAIDMGPYDTGAARKSDLGTISTKADTDYVATSALALRLDTGNASFTGDIDVTGDVGAATLGITGHSTLTTASATVIASTRLKATEGLTQVTTDGNDNGAVYMASGGDVGVSRGSYVYLFANEHDTYSGELWLTAGGTASGTIKFHSGIAGGEVARIAPSGNLLIATTTDDGVNKLQVNGSMRLIGGAAPGSPTEGSIYFNSTDKKFYGWNGTAWKQLDN